MAYVHGYDPREAERLADQAGTLVELLHSDTRYMPGDRVLEAGCGVGAQTTTLAANSPEALFTSVDIEPASVAEATRRVEEHGLTNVSLLQGDLHDLDLPEHGFDHAFVCFVLEHLTDPVEALRRITRHVKPGGTLTVIEGDHGSTTFHPEDADARAAIDCQVRLQADAGGDATIGRRLFGVLTQAGLQEVHVSPRLVYVDASRPELVEGFTRRTFTAMVEGVRASALQAELITAERFDAGIAALHRTTEPDGAFTYTFFKATAVVA